MSAQARTEHIAPQRKPLDDASYAAELYDDGSINRLGNLTLLPQDLNDLVGNKDWKSKREAFTIVSETNQDARVAALEDGSLYKLKAKAKALLASADFIPFCTFVAQYPGDCFDYNFVGARGERLAELAWDRLWADLV